MVSKQTGEPNGKTARPDFIQASLRRFQLAKNPETSLAKCMIKENLQLNSSKLKDHMVAPCFHPALEYDLLEKAKL